MVIYDIYIIYQVLSLVAQTVKGLSTMRETWFRSLSWEDPWRRKWQSTPVLLPGKSHGQRSLVGYSPWGREGSDMTERLHFHFSLSCTVEENGNPLQYCWLENPRDGSLVGCRLWDRTELGTTDMT